MKKKIIFPINKKIIFLLIGPEVLKIIFNYINYNYTFITILIPIFTMNTKQY